MPPISTPRLELREGSQAIFRIPPQDRAGLGAALGVRVPENWPVEHYDDDPLQWCLAHLEKDPECAPWLLRYLILRETNTLIGTVGCSPAENEEVVIGYAVLPQFRRKGYASEALMALVQWVFGHEHVERVVGYTYPHLEPSIGVMRKAGFRFTGEGPEAGTSRDELAKCYTPPAP